MHYPKAPIVEAAINLHFAGKLPTRTLQKSVKAAASNYPLSVGEDMVIYQIDASTNRLTSQTVQHGFRVSSYDQSELCIHREQDFIVSKLAPYGRWEDFVSRAKRDWSKFSKAARPGAIERVGLRYINRIDVPCGSDEKVKVEDYLSVWPRLPDLGDDLRIDNYVMQIQRSFNDGCKLIVNSSPTGSPLPERTAFLLDIDVFRTGPLKRSDEAWTILEDMRKHKNFIFEHLITEKARELFR